MSLKRGIGGTDGLDWRERFELIDARLRHARRGGDYEFVITSDHHSAVLVQDDASFGSNNCRLYDCPDMFYIVHPSNIHHLALVRPRILLSTAHPPRPIQVRLLSPTVTRH